MDKPIPEAVVEAVARAICVSCEENPDNQGDARGNEFRWQDYRDTALAAVSAFTAAQQQVQAAADDMGGFSSDTAALAFLHIIGNGNPNVERAVKRLRQSLIAKSTQQDGGEDAPGSRAWMAEVCRAAALSLAAHGVHNDQLSKVADWIAQQPAPSTPVGVKTLSEFMAEQEALHPGIRDKVQAATDELRESLAQQTSVAPVRVEDVEVLKRLRAALPDVGLNGWWLGVEVLDRVIATLTQQTTAGAAMEFDGTDREVLREFIRICREHKPVGAWPGERVCKAIERAMDNEKPFRFIAEEDMAPERESSMKDADRMLSGPRRRHAPPPAGNAEAEALAKHQPCGCVVCTCEDEKQCQGCGAKHCGNRTNHPDYVKQQPEVRGALGVDAWRALWLVLRQTGTVVVPRHDIASADWSKCQIEQTEHPLTGAVQFRATRLDAQPGGAE